jgi:hypothetical protein
MRRSIISRLTAFLTARAASSIAGSARRRRISIGKCIALVVAAAILGFDASPASATKIKLTATRQQVSAACDKLGSAGYCSGCNATSGGYSCDNVANGCHVDCNANGSCTGGCPDKVVAVPRSRLQDLLAGVGRAAQPGAPSPRPRRMPAGGLLEGTPGFSSQGPAATGSPLGGGAGPAPAPGPVLR